MNKSPKNKGEVLRYLGYKGQGMDNITNLLIEESMEEMRKLIYERYDYKVFNISKDETDLWLRDSNFKLVGHDIKKHLSKSEECILLGVTLGHDVDRRIRYYEKISMDRALILDACATTAIEEICDEICEEIGSELEKSNKKLTKRFSPGYGDFPLDIQGEFLSVIGASKSIGLTSTYSSILIPRKSVTAIMGIIDINDKEEEKSCLKCNKYSTCMFREGDGGCES